MPSAVLVGEGSLLTACGDLLLHRGHDVRGVVSRAGAVRAWAHERGLATGETIADLRALLDAEPVDHLFSIANLRMLPADLLARCRLAVNFHDAVLPRDAGVHASAWAVLGRARHHGITWHVMTAEADAGDILVQRSFPLAPDESSFTLNVRCWQAGFEAFGELVDALSTGGVARRPQNPARRTYHGCTDRPAGGLVLSWHRPAEELAALVRATDFGVHDNGFGTAQLLVAGELVAVTEAVAVDAVGPSALTQAPGTVVAVDADRLQLATVTGDLVLRGLSRAGSSFAGDPVAPDALLATLGLGIGDVLDAPAPPDVAELTAVHARALAHEAWWVARLGDLEPLDVPHRQAAAPPPSSSSDTGVLVVDVAGRPGLGDDPATGVLAATLAFLGQLAGTSAFDVGLRLPPVSPSPAARALVAPVVPFRAPALAVDGTFADHLQAVADQLTATRAQDVVLRDVALRYPHLRESGGLAGALPVELEIVPTPDGLRGRADLLTAGGPSDARPALRVQVTADGRACHWVVDHRVVDEREAEILRDAFVAFVADLDPALPLGAATLVSPAEHRALVALSQTATDYPHDRCTHQLFADQVRRRPDAVAVVAGSRTLTYGELDARAARLARRLGQRGIGPGDRVGLYLERSPDLVCALLAVMRSGAAYVPLDPIYPPARVADMLDDAGAALVVTHTHLADRLGRGRGAPPTLVLDLGAAGVAVDSDDSQDHGIADDADTSYDRARADDPAYVIYTSGSTGRPKGVQIGHRALTNFLCAMAVAPGCRSGDRLLAVTTICFDIATLELYLPLLTGATVEIAPADVAADGPALRSMIERTRPTLLQATPATWKMLLAAGWDGDPGLTALCGGEALPADLAGALLDRTATLWNLYGPTETTVWSAAVRIEPGRPVTLGRPIANTTCHVLDGRGRLVPRGVPGELHVGGAGVADGYHRRPELTAERFLPEPAHLLGDVGGVGDGGGVGGVGGVGGRRMYRTGDIVRWRVDGELEYLGRSDHQVKIRGFRIEPGEIEAALLVHPAVAQAVVVARTDDRGDVRLAGYVVAAPGTALQPAALRAHLATTLPDYMVPAAVVVLDALPLTPNGKIDRQALPAPDLRAAASGRPPRTPLERKLCALFGEALGLDDVGADDSFFDLGGDSLVVTRLLTRGRDAGLRLRARDVFEHRTPEALALHLDRARDRHDLTAPSPTAGTTGTGVSTSGSGSTSMSRTGSSRSGPAPLDLAAEVALPADIALPAGVPAGGSTGHGQVLLTGATGFLGAFLLRELVRAGATVHCLVRGRDRDGARARLRANLDRYELGAELVSAPIEVVVGDLAAPGLGLTTDEHRRLADRIDGVYHAGAVVHWLHRYADMRATNVGGTVEVLRLAARRAVPVHHVSSLGVFAHRATHAGRHDVDAPTGPPGDLLTGYQRSKWVAEQTVGLARDRGLPVTVHRVARVSGDATTGACQHDDLLWRLLKGCIEVGGVPADTDLVFDLVPVDFVSAALVWLSRRPESVGGTFHLSNPVLTPLGVVVDHLREVGFVLPDLDHDKWIDLVDGDPANAAHPLLDVLRATAWDTGRIEVPLDPGSTVRALAGSGLTCPAIDERLLDVYVDHFVRTGYFPAPT